MREKKRFTLSNSDIGEIVDTVRENALKNKADRKEVIRITLTLEELLLQYQEHMGEEVSLVLVQDTLASRYRIQVLISALSFNPFETTENGEILHGLLSGQGLALQWSYRDGNNTLTYSFKRQRKNSMLIQLVTSLLAAGLLSLVCSFLPFHIGDFISNSIINPIYETFIGLITFISGPLVLLSVMWGVFSIGDVTTLSNVGKRMILRFIVMMFVGAGIMVLVMFPFYKISQGGEGAFAFADLYAMILDIIPENIISPFLNGNTLQIIFIAVIVGIAMLLLSEKMTVAAKFVEQTNFIVQLIMETISKLIPLFIFMSIFILIQSGGLSLLLGSFKLIFSNTVASFAVLLAFFLTVCIRFKVSPKVLISKMSSTFLIAITTASSSAAFANDMETCENKLGIDQRLVNIGVPLGQTIFMPGTNVLFYGLALYIADYYGMPISLPWLGTLSILVVILSIAAPPVPGGGLACYAMIVAQMGFPSDAVAMFCALGVIPEFIAVAVNISSLQMELLELSSGLGMLNLEKLRK